jgi:coenzyme F420-reducing hydrogenase alpha subunit
VANRRDLRIEVPVLARVEGEGALELEIRDGAISDLRLRIYEPPRLFEKFLEGHGPDEVVDQVARICGICPVAYQITAVQAFERLFGVDPGDWARRMRRLMYCGEWLQSHALHIHLLAAPDFLGFDNAIAMAGEHPQVVRRGLRLQALGNELIALLGARSVHPVGLRVGGFHRAPSAAEAAAMLTRVEQALPEAEALLRWTATLPLPDDRQAFTSVALAAPDSYAIEHGRIRSDRGLDCADADWDRQFREFQAPHSTALYAELQDEPYLVGPLARLNLNLAQLPHTVGEVLAETGIAFPSDNMFHSIVARAAEVLLALHEARELLRDYRVPAAPAVPWTPHAGVAVAASEAPRGLLWHRYEVDEDGRVAAARIVPPTSQNQGRCEQDIRQALQAYGLDRPDAALQLRAETVIRNYDPCISCATHFLRLKTRRR